MFVGWVVTGMLLGSGAQAWAPDAVRTLPVPHSVAAVALASQDGRVLLAAVGPDRASLVDPMTGEVLGTVERGGVAVALADQNGDKLLDLVLCGPDGVQLVPGRPDGLGAPARLLDSACYAVTHYREEARGLHLVTAGQRVQTWPVLPDGLLDEGKTLVVGLPEGVLLAAGDGRIGIAVAGDDRFVEHTEGGRSHYTAAADVGGLALGPRGWAWTVPERDAVEDIKRRWIPVADEPRGLIAGELDGDGQIDLVVLHPRGVGVLLAEAHTEQWVALESAPVGAAIADLDGDGCGDLGLVDVTGRVVLYRADCGAQMAEVPRALPAGLTEVVALPEPNPTHPPPPTPVRPPRMVEPPVPHGAVVSRRPPVPGEAGRRPAPPGFDAPLSEKLSDVKGTAPTSSARARPVVVSETRFVLGAHVGEPLDVELVDPKGRTSRFSARGVPAGMVVHADGRISWTPGAADAGVWDASLLLWGTSGVVRTIPFELTVYEARTESATSTESVQRLYVDDSWPVVQATVGVPLMVYLEDARGVVDSWTGRGGPSGLLVSTDGVLTYTPRPEHAGEWRVELKVWGGPDLVRNAGIRLRVGDGSGSPYRSDSARSGPGGSTTAPRPPSDRERGFFEVRTCLLSAGVAGGASEGGLSWERLGESVFFSASPAAAATCEGGAKSGFWWFGGVDTAPVYVYLLNGDDTGVHTLALTAGLGFGSDKVRFGPYATAGIVLAGFGLRLVALPFETQQGAKHGFELRGTWLASSARSGQLMLMYGFSFDRR